MIRNGALSAGHARALLSIEDPEEQNSMAKKAADGLLTVRDIENAAKRTISRLKQQKREKLSKRTAFTTRWRLR